MVAVATRHMADGEDQLIVSRIRVGVIGCGDIAVSGHLPALGRCPDVELVAVLDLDPARAEPVAARYRCQVLTSVPAFAERGADAVIIATPPQVTARLTMEAIALGLDVLCEKPMATDLDSAIEVQRAVEQSDRVVQVGFKNRFSPLIRAVGSWIRDGQLGSPIAFTLGGFDEALDHADPVHERRIRDFLSVAPSFVHEGAHFADHLAYLTGSEPVDVQAVGLTSMADLGSENFVSALVRYASGDVARLEIGWLFPSSPVGEFRALGPDGIALVDRPGGVATLTRRDRTEQVRLDRPWNDLCFDLQLEHFLSCVRQRSTPETSVAAGVASLRLGLQVMHAMRRRGGG